MDKDLDKDLDLDLDLDKDLDMNQEKNQDNKLDEIVFLKPTSLMFIYNGISYYADPGIVFSQITEIKDMANFDDPVVLSHGSHGPVPRYIVNLWIWSMCTKSMDLTKIKPHDIVCFLDHIDRYPTDSVSIRTIEQDLIEYFDILSIGILQTIDTRYLIDLCQRYWLKYLYLWIHNQRKNKVNPQIQ